MAWLPLVLVGLLAEIWEYGPLAGVPLLLAAAWRAGDWRLVAADVVFAVAAVFGWTPLPAVVAFAGALLLAAHDLHARRPGLWFPLLATGLAVFVGWQGSLWLTDEPWRAWAPMTESVSMAFETGLTALDWYEPPPPMTWVPFAVVAVLCAGAAVAFARDREWVPLVVVGLLGAVWEYGSLVGIAVLTVIAGWRRGPRLIAATAVYAVAALFEPPPYAAIVAVAAALVIAAHDLHARRPGAWFPLLALGLGLATATLEVYRFGSAALEVHRRSVMELSSHELSAVAVVGIGPDPGVHEARALATVVVVGLVLWAWRTRDLLVAATAVGYLVAAWYVPGRPELVVLVGAAVAVARDSRTRTG
ncbi:hypothetical protein ABZ816_17045 [Actinosynnema sp. NPDC047251]|uniref:Putative membrane protein n=1 Tax=Saccharothrix espanaensis (strain ATCC 51144 / DSM 44229 / JCM 9112 / NBRC 15066 / NRRL 15764) TaxID=1179773 RepID=K0JRU1_SACES|nr:hypothetical protein [Saccharothrix espanaensis]CCH30395.1 putative membrane protein [Saccharothrix espanaensis DSM 44229]